MYYSGWFEPFQAGFATTAARQRRGAARADGPDERFSIAGIAHDRYDGYLSEYAEAVRAYGHPVILSFGHGDERVVVLLGLHAHVSRGFRGRLAAHRHRVPRAGSPQRDLAVDGQHRQRYAERQDPSPGPWWPGSAYVNWVGIDGYYLKPSWQFAPLFGPTIGAVRALTNDPILVAETGATACRRPAREDRPTCSLESASMDCSGWCGSTLRITRAKTSASAAPRLSPRSDKGASTYHQAWIMNGPLRTDTVARSHVNGGVGRQVAWRDATDSRSLVPIWGNHRRSARVRKRFGPMTYAAAAIAGRGRYRCCGRCR